jgi:hypothetical protein
MRTDPRVRKGDRLLIFFGVLLALGIVLRLAGII